MKHKNRGSLNDFEVARLYQIGREHSDEAYNLIRRLHRCGAIPDAPDMFAFKKLGEAK